MHAPSARSSLALAAAVLALLPLVTALVPLAAAQEPAMAVQRTAAQGLVLRAVSDVSVAVVSDEPVPDPFLRGRIDFHGANLAGITARIDELQRLLAGAAGTSLEAQIRRELAYQERKRAEEEALLAYALGNGPSPAAEAAQACKPEPGSEETSDGTWANFLRNLLPYTNAVEYWQPKLISHVIARPEQGSSYALDMVQILCKQLGNFESNAGFIPEPLREEYDAALLDYWVAIKSIAGNMSASNPLPALLENAVALQQAALARIGAVLKQAAPR